MNEVKEKEVKAEERALTAEEKAEIAAFQARKARDEQLEKLSKKTEKDKSGDDLLEEAYAGLSMTHAELKTEIEAYFYKNGRWEDPAKAADEADKEAEKAAKEAEKAQEKASEKK